MNRRHDPIEYLATVDAFLREQLRQSTSNTFLRRPEPRPGFIDARREDGCIPCITEVEHA